MSISKAAADFLVANAAGEHDEFNSEFVNCCDIVLGDATVFYCSNSGGLGIWVVVNVIYEPDWVYEESNVGITFLTHTGTTINFTYEPTQHLRVAYRL